MIVQHPFVNWRLAIALIIQFYVFENEKTNNVVYAVAGDTFVMGLHELVNHGNTVKFMVTKDKK